VGRLPTTLTLLLTLQLALKQRFYVPQCRFGRLSIRGNMQS